MPGKLSGWHCLSREKRALKLVDVQDFVDGVALEGLDGFVFGEAEGVVGVGYGADALLAALPEFAAVAVRENRGAFCVAWQKIA
jgi:hypothetical protein